MTCRGTECVFVNPAVCQSASARRHKPLSAASPLTHHRALSWARPGGRAEGARAGLGRCLLPPPPPAAPRRGGPCGAALKVSEEGWQLCRPSVGRPSLPGASLSSIREAGIRAMATPLGGSAQEVVAMFVQPPFSFQQVCVLSVWLRWVFGCGMQGLCHGT